MTAPLWTVQAIMEATGAERAGALPDAITGISIDSRSIKAGEAFFAIKGDTLDGHDLRCGRAQGRRRPRGGRTAPHSSLPRLRGRVGEGELHGSDSRTGPFPDPPPQAGEGKAGVAAGEKKGGVAAREGQGRDEAID